MLNQTNKTTNVTRSGPTAARGFSRVPDAFLDQSLAGLSGTAVKVYLVLLRHSDRAGRSWPSIDRIGRCCGVTGRTIQTALAELRAARVVTQTDRGHTGQSNLYRLEETFTAGVKPVSSPGRNFTAATPEADFHPTRVNEPNPMNQGFSGPGRNQTQTGRRFDIGYRPETPEARQLRDRHRHRRQVESSAEQQAAADDARHLAERLAAVEPDELARLKAIALAKLPAGMARMLTNADPLTSPVLGGLVAGEIGASAGV